jgi:2'-5' RNA ligase
MTPNWFVAWPVSGAEKWIAALEAEAPGGLNFLAPADLHVTLAFLGRYEPALLKKISALIESLPLTAIDKVSINQFIALPQPRRFSSLAFVLGTGRLEAEKQITKWRDRICRESGARIETWAALSHVTIARPDRRIGEADRDASLEWMMQLPAQKEIALRLERPRIYTWAERGADTRYRILA